MRHLACTMLFSLALAGPTAALGADGVVISTVDLYAGPDMDYPAVAELPAGTPVDVQGCLEGWTWCDVIAAGTRGWVAGTFVQYTYESQPVIVADYGPRIGIPIVAFSIGVYWDHYYRDRPFYRDRDRWYGRPIESRAPPRPSGWREGDRADYDRPPPASARQPLPSVHQPAAQPTPSAGYRPPPERQPENRPPSPTNRAAPAVNRPPPVEEHGHTVSSPAAHPAGQEHRPPQGEDHGHEKQAPHPEPKKQDDNGH